jgi:hypothetical protein
MRKECRRLFNGIISAQNREKPERSSRLFDAKHEIPFGFVSNGPRPHVEECLTGMRRLSLSAEAG